MPQEINLSRYRHCQPFLCLPTQLTSDCLLVANSLALSAEGLGLKFNHKVIFPIMHNS
jgi:hypothetical protein